MRERNALTKRGGKKAINKDEKRADCYRSLGRNYSTCKRQNNSFVTKNTSPESYFQSHKE